jgi:hypothetical protein
VFPVFGSSVEVQLAKPNAAISDSTIKVPRTRGAVQNFWGLVKGFRDKDISILPSGKILI